MKDKTQESINELKKEIKDRDASFITAYNFVMANHNENDDVRPIPVTVDNIDTTQYDDLRSLCELYYMIRKETVKKQIIEP